MISGRQYYEIPPVRGGGGGGGAGNAANGYGGVHPHRFDPTFGDGYGHGHGHGHGHGYSRSGGHGGYHYDRNHGTRQAQQEEAGYPYGYDDNDVKPARAAPAARQSLSALDEKRANEIRRGVYAHVFLDVKNSSKSEVLIQQHKRRASASPAASTYVVRDGNRLRVPGRFSSRPAVAAAATLNPIMAASHGPAPAYFGAPDLYPKRDQSMNAMAPARSSPRIARVPYALQTTPAEEKGVVEAMPTPLNRPRKLSQASTVTVTSINSPRDSFDSRSRSSSWSSNRSSFESRDSWKPDYLQQRPTIPAAFRKKAKPGEIFARLPGEVLELILDELKKSHLEKGSNSCATCWMRDVCSVSLSARKWCKFARVALYEDIQLVGLDSTSQKKKYKLGFGSRMMLLRRTLRANSYLAAMVHTVKVPSAPAGIALEDYYNQVAALVMACPNFERLMGIHPQYDHSYSKLFHALSTRKRLKHMDWIVQTSPFQRQHRFRTTSSESVPTLSQPQRENVTPGDLQPHQSATFLDFHVDWAHLTTLTIHCLPGATLTPDNLVSSALMHLTSLQHLYLSRMPVTAFNDSTLLTLPPLRTLSLSHVPGVTSAGISALATLPTSQAIQKLTLRHTNLDSLPALARIFSNFTYLEVFTLVQSFAPTLPEDTFIWLMPYLASGSLRKLHWDITSNTTNANAADSILARSIAAGGFPSLRSLRTPNDPEGAFQALCRPVERVDFSSDRFRTPVARSASFPAATPHAPTTKPKSPTSAGGAGLPPPSETFRESSDLHQARLAAQARLEAARPFPRFFVNVIDEDGTLLEKYGLAGFMGTIESRITYNLRPDPGAKDERGGLVEMADLMGSSHGEDIPNGKEGCTGRWNVSSAVAEKKDKERWWHTERGRWHQPQLA
ncbi:hypothetical protein CkaCkLH20_02819 [Colletotrichum karsti]|uniref:F-box domain-containing protein n=1 Tax=Colletotrichum karsti TaxID=1095194 RepID=A0A9P6IBU9_9PEZI|nr:uncharacterized protein CkaCkLH20_02819 [Colletotrichum karsti]KAF9880008.1 hypothetical protein CkaCkLH20_02819 [Colletotrichum karsti]